MDYFIFQQINQLAGSCAFLDNTGIFFAEYFQYFLVLFLVLFLVKNFKKYWPMVFGAGIAAILARFGITTLIRHFWQRSRPFINNNVNLVVNYSNESSFPSGHAAFFFAIATVVYLHNKKAGILFFVGALLISLGRIFVGIHWPLDILAGAIVGIFSGWLASKIFRKIKL